jgi:hypothetical protein
VRAIASETVATVWKTMWGGEEAIENKQKEKSHADKR